MTTRAFVKRALVLTLGAAAACGSSSDNTTVTCSSLTPSDCGGDPAGNWNLEALCGSSQVAIDESLPAECSGTALTLQPGTPSGSATFGGGSYTNNATLAFTASTTFSGACMTALASGGDVGATCTAIGPLASGQGLTLTCALSGGNCNCTGSLSQTENASGTYTVSGNQLTLKPTTSSTGDLTPATSTFCVRSGYLIAEIPATVTGAQPMHLVFKKR